MRLSDFDEHASVRSIAALASMALATLRKRGELQTVRTMCRGELALVQDVEDARDKEKE